MNRTVLSALALCAALAACSPAAPPAAEEATPTVRLYAMDCGHLRTTDAGPFSDEHVYDGQTRDLVDPCYLIRHANGDLLWDLGLPQSLVDDPDGVTFGGTTTLSATKRLTDQLTELGIAPADIEFVSFSHSHFDHLANVGLFPQARWIADVDERAYMFRPEARSDENFASYAMLENAPNTILIEGDASYDVFGDGSMTIIQAPGHTPGHTILRVNLANAGVVLLTGDMYHMAESRERRTVPTFNTDRAQTLASMDMIEALAAQTNARVVRQHVPEDFAAMPTFPEALD